MSYYYNTKMTYSSQEDDNFGMSEDSYMEDGDPMKASGSVDKESLEYKKRRQKNNEGNDFSMCLLVMTNYIISH